MHTIRDRRWPPTPRLVVACMATAGVVACATPGGDEGALDRSQEAPSDRQHAPTPSGPQGPAPPDREDATAQAVAAATHFLDTYVRADGRVERPGQGGDTVSEGQAYALLAAVAVGDRERFDAVWRWTRDHLLRDDGLLAFHWADGAVVDASPASDADLDTARALVLAAESFGVDRYNRQAAELSTAILEHEVVEIGGEPVLVAGPWATEPPYWLNPSYLSPRAFGLLASSLDDPRWQALRASSYRMVDALTDAPAALPPDWARIAPSGEARPAPAPGSAGRPRYGYDAVRVPIRLGADCDPRGRELAAAMWPFLREQAPPGPVDVYGLEGERVGDAPHPVSLVAAAGAAHAAGDEDATAHLLARAQRLDRERPSYYGAAWVALGRVLLSTDLLAECPPRDGGR